jgi:hypothetical protein
MSYIREALHGAAFYVRLCLITPMLMVIIYFLFSIILALGTLDAVFHTRASYFYHREPTTKSDVNTGTPLGRCVLLLQLRPSSPNLYPRIVAKKRHSFLFFLSVCFSFIVDYMFVSVTCEDMPFFSLQTRRISPLLHAFDSSCCHGCKPREPTKCTCLSCVD